MMKIDKISDSIIRDAKAEAGKIIDDAKKEIKAEIKSAESELEKKRAEVVSDYEKALDREMKESVAAAELEVRKNVHQARDEIADKVIERAFSRLIKIKKSRKKYEKAIAGFYRRAADELGGGELEVVCGRDDDDLVKRIVKKGDSVKNDAKIAGGIIVKKKGRGVLIDLTFSTLMKDRESDIKAYIYKKLFK